MRYTRIIANALLLEILPSIETFVVVGVVDVDGTYGSAVYHS